jgi:uncharacterized membrane protein
MNHKKMEIISGLLVLAAIVSSFYFYPLLPERVITHWNFAGQADGWNSKNFQVIFFPTLIVIMFLLFKFLPRLDPKVMERPADFNEVYSWLRLVIIFFFTGLYLLTNFVNLGYDWPISKIMPSLVGLLFIVIGFLIKDIKQNWFVGIRTPWTLSSEEVWRKTHRFGSKVFIIAGVVFLFLPFLSRQWNAFFFILLILLIFSSLVYSYLIFRKVKKNNLPK